MKVPTILAKLRDLDIQVWADGDRLRCSAPAGTLTPELHDELRQHKSEILNFLDSAGSLARQQRAIVPLQPHGSRPAIFAFGGHNGDVFCFRALSRHLGEDQPFFGLQPPGLDGGEEPLARIEDLAAYFATEIRAFQPKGPYVLAGFCAGGAIAFELARQLLRDGAELMTPALFGAPYPTAYRRLPRWRKCLGAHVERLVAHARELVSLPSDRRRQYITERLLQRKTRPDNEGSFGQNPVLARRARVARATFAALRRYVPGYFAGPVDLFLPCKDWVRSCEKPLRWRSVAQHAEEYFGPSGCSTDNMLLEPYASTFARLFEERRAKENEFVIAARRISPALINGSLVKLHSA